MAVGEQPADQVAADEAAAAGHGPGHEYLAITFNISAPARADGTRRPEIFETPPRRARARTSISASGRPARAALTIISVGQPYVISRSASASSASRRTAR